MMEMVLLWGENPLKLMRTSLFLAWFSMAAKTMATICPNTVAAAAPRIPMAGTPRSPKIRIGSSMMLMMAPVPWVIMQ